MIQRSYAACCFHTDCRSCNAAYQFDVFYCRSIGCGTRRCFNEIGSCFKGDPACDDLFAVCQIRGFDDDFDQCAFCILCHAGYICGAHDIRYLPPYKVVITGF